MRPRYERMQGDRNAWSRNLRVLGVDHLFISALSAYEIDNVWHNDYGFPIEDEWARADPQAFALVYENPQVRIYGSGVASVPNQRFADIFRAGHPASLRCSSLTYAQ